MKLHPENDPNAVQLSQSALEAYFQCPARLKLSSEWKRRGRFMPIQLRDGIDAHQLIAGEEVADASPNAVGYYESLLDLEVSRGVEVWAHEIEQVICLEEGIYFKRILDGIGLYQGAPVIIDYKTSSKGPWPYFKSGRNRIIPKSMSFQAVSYLIPPDDQGELDRFGLNVWPDTFLFLVSDASGHGDIVVYQRDMDKEMNFREACRVVADAIHADRFPHYYGNPCGLLGTSWACGFLEYCYKLDGWEDIYEPAHEIEEDV